MNKYKLITFLFLFSLKAFAQTPHLTGEMSLSTKKGTISCEFNLSNIPSLEDYTIWLNTGFNFARITDESGEIKYQYKKVYNDKSSEAFQYYITPQPNQGKFFPKTLKFTYTGAFPVISDTTLMYETGDWKGNIAFNGTTVRMTDQSAWYPILYDVQNDKVINSYTYTIKVNNEEGGATYLNGEIPKAGGANIFSSNVPVPMLLFAGAFTFLQQQDIYFINTRLSAPERGLLSQLTTSMVNFYSDKMNIPYGSKISYMETTPVSKYNAWLFVTYPTVALVGRQFTMHNLFRNSPNLAVDTASFSLIAHELAHYYFGTLFTPNSDLRWVFLEGVNEYLSLQFVKEKFGKMAYQKRVLKYLMATEGIKQLIPLDKLKANTPLDDAYKYNYIPLLLTAMEKEVGLKQMWRWLNLVANSKNEITNYSFFKSSLIRSGIPPKTYDAFEERFIMNEKSKENLIGQVKR